MYGAILRLDRNCFRGLVEVDQLTLGGFHPFPAQVVYLFRRLVFPLGREMNGDLSPFLQSMERVLCSRTGSFAALNGGPLHQMKRVLSAILRLHENGFSRAVNLFDLSNKNVRRKDTGT